MTFEEAVKHTDLRSFGHVHLNKFTGKHELIPAKTGMSFLISSGSLFHDFEVRHDDRGFLAMVTRTVGVGPNRISDVLYREIFDNFDDAMAFVQSKLEGFFRGRLVIEKET